MEAKNAAPRLMVTKEVPKKVIMKIGRPGYKVSYVGSSGTSILFMNSKTKCSISACKIFILKTF